MSLSLALLVYTPKVQLVYSYNFFHVNSDDRSHLLLPILVKHLDNKDVGKQPVLQLQIINVTTQLSGHVKHHASVTIVGAISDLIKHLRKCLIRSSEPSSSDLQSGLENCISNLSCKVCIMLY